MLRRRLLATTCAGCGGLVAGCAAPSDSGSTDGSLTVRVTNRTAESQSITVTVADTDGEVVERVADDWVAADVSETFESAGYRGGAYTVRVRGPDWATSGWWDRTTCADYVFATLLEDDEPSVTADATCRSAE